MLRHLLLLLLFLISGHPLLLELILPLVLELSLEIGHLLIYLLLGLPLWYGDPFQRIHTLLLCL